jgi:hypothetical protein
MQQLTQLEYERSGLLYTFTLKYQDQKEQLFINVIRKENYAEWETTILSDSFVQMHNLDTIQVNYSPCAKYRIISDYVSNQLDDMHNMIFPDAVVDVDQPVNIIITSSPKYGKRSYIPISIYPKKLSQIEILTKDFSFYKETMSKQIDALQSRIAQLEQAVLPQVTNNKRISVLGFGIW